MQKMDHDYKTTLLQEAVATAATAAANFTEQEKKEHRGTPKKEEEEKISRNKSLSSSTIIIITSRQIMSSSATFTAQEEEESLLPWWLTTTTTTTTTDEALPFSLSPSPIYGFTTTAATSVSHHEQQHPPLPAVVIVNHNENIHACDQVIVNDNKQQQQQQQQQPRRKRRRRRRRNNAQETTTISVTSFQTTETTTAIEESAPTKSAESTSVPSSSTESSTTSTRSSRVIRDVNDGHRIAHLATILPLTTMNNNNQHELVDYLFYEQASAWLAWFHLSQRHGHQNQAALIIVNNTTTTTNSNNNNISTLSTLLPNVAQRLSKCDIEFTISMHDSQFSPLHAARQLLQIMQRNANSNANKRRRRRRRRRRRTNGIIEIEPSVPPISNNNSSSNNNNNIDSTSLDNDDNDRDDIRQQVMTLLTPPLPMTVIGAARSAVSAALSTLASGYEIPQISGSSTASNLDGMPLFARTVPTNTGDAQALIYYLVNVLHIHHVAIIYINDTFGTEFHAALIQQAAALRQQQSQDDEQSNLQIMSIQLDVSTNSDGMTAALQRLVDCQYRYVIAILNADDSWRALLQMAATQNLVGPDSDGYTWFLTESNIEVVDPSFVIHSSNSSDMKQQRNLAMALHGMGVLLIDIPKHDGFDEALQQFQQDETITIQHHSNTDNTTSMTTTTSLHELFYSHQAEAHADLVQNYTYPPVGQSYYQYLLYDAVMAVAIAACEVESNTTTNDNGLFTGPELYSQLLQTEFQGISRHVSFDHKTGTRRGQDFRYRMVNLVLKENGQYDNHDSSTSSRIWQFDATTSAIIDLAGNSSSYGDDNNSNNSSNNHSPKIDIMHSFVYADSTTDAPPDLPPVEQNLNLISTTSRGIGLTLGCLVMASSIGWIVWTLTHRNKDVVRSSQPIFLCILCLGTFILAFATIPLSLQEPVAQQTLDVACMSTVWLLAFGFLLVFSALFSKTWRLNKLYRSGRAFRRVTVKPKDVIWPSVVLSIINIGLLTCWTIITPWTWQRIPLDNYDSFGRSVESYGSCTAAPPQDATTTSTTTDRSNLVLAFVIPIACVNLTALIFASYQAYKACKLQVPTEYSEANAIFFSFAMLLETFIIGLPVLWLVKEDPTTSFLIRCILISICCLGIQMPLFLPKFNRRREVAFRRTMAISTGTPVSRCGNVHVNINQLSNIFEEEAVPGVTTNSVIPNNNSNSSHGTAVGNGEKCGKPAPKMGLSKVTRSPQYYQQLEMNHYRSVSRQSTASEVA